MPKLLLFAPCEKVIVDKRDNTASLIGLLEALNLSISASELTDFPPDVSAPLTWEILALWQVEPEDVGKELETRLTIVPSSGEEASIGDVSSIKFEPDKPNSRNVLKIFGFPLKPILTADHCSLRLFLREQGGNHPWKLVADYPLVIRHAQKPDGKPTS